MCGSVLIADLTDQYAASNEAVQREQSRLLAYSGWNVALAELQQSGGGSPLQEETSAGMFTVDMEQHGTKPAVWEVQAIGASGIYKRMVSGLVQCISFPFSGTETWNVREPGDVSLGASILLLEDTTYCLQESYGAPLGITSAQQLPVTVEVADDITVDTLCIFGDLYVSGSLTASALYVTGDIAGTGQIDCGAQYSGYESGPLYQIRVLERTVV